MGPVGNLGFTIRDEIVAKIQKWQEQTHSKITKALPIPDGTRKNRRGGKRFRKNKERYAMTEVRRAANRIGFNHQKDETLNEDESIIQEMNGPLGNTKLNSTKQKYKHRNTEKRKINQSFASKGTLGLSSPFSFTPIQGIELSSTTVTNTTDVADGTHS